MQRSVALLLLLAALVLAAPAAADTASSLTLKDAHGKLDLGGTGACAVLSGGTVRCWGEGEEGKLGLGTMARTSLGDDEHPAAVGTIALGDTATAVTVGDRHACAVLGAGGMRCWGSGDQGQLGIGSSTDIGDNEHPLSQVAIDFGGATVKAASAGDDHTCAILSTNALRCWGANARGQLGVGDKTLRYTPVAVNLGAGRTAKAVAADGDHTCAILDNGTVKCWGDGTWAATGLGSTDDAYVPTQVFLPAGRTAEAIDTSPGHTCVVLDDDTVRCWGLGDSGQLGYASKATIGDDELPGNQPAVQLGGGVQSISLSSHNTCAHLLGGALRCWGAGGFGELGNGVSANVGDDEHPSTAATVTPPAGLSIVASSGGSETRCFTFSDGTIRCAGWSAYGQTGWPDVLNAGSIADVQKKPVAQVPAIRFGGGGSDLNVRAAVSGSDMMPVDGYRDVELTVRNSGPQAINGAVVQAPTSDGLELSYKTGDGTFDNLKDEWTVGAMNAGEARTITLTLKATKTGGKNIAASVKSINGPADVDSTPGDGIAGGEDDQDELGITVMAGADLSIDTQIATSELPVGGTRTMTVKVTNDGPAAASGVVATRIGDDSWYVGAGTMSQGSAGSGGDWNVGTLAAGQSATVTYPMTAKDAGSKGVGAKLTTAGQLDKDSGDRQSTVVVPIVLGADIEIKTNPDSSGYVGQSDAAYVYAYNKSGTTADVKVKVTLPVGLELTSVDGAGWDAQTSTITFAGFAPGTNRTVTFKSKGVAEGTHVVAAEVVSSTKLDPDSTPGNGLAAGEDDAFTRTATLKPYAPTTTKPPQVTPTTSTTRPGATTPSTRTATTTTPASRTVLSRPLVRVAKRVPTVRLSASRGATVQLAVQRRVGKRWVLVQQKKVGTGPKRTSHRLRRLAKGRYRLVASVPGQPGTQTVRFSVA